MKETESYMDTNCWITCMEKNGYITFQALTAPVRDCWYPSFLAVRLYSSQCVNRSLSCREHNDGSQRLYFFLRHAQIHPKSAEPENEILLNIPHTKVITNCDFKRCSFSPIILCLTNSRKREGATTWQRCTKTKCEPPISVQTTASFYVKQTRHMKNGRQHCLNVLLFLAVPHIIKFGLFLIADYLWGFL